MKKIICMFLLCAVLFSLSGCSTTKEHISEIIENYDKYSEVLSDKGIEAKVEDTEIKSGIYLNDNGKVLTVISPDGRQYVFYTIDGAHMSHSFRGDASLIYREGNCTINGSEVRYRVSICIQFRNKKTSVQVHYDSADDYVGGTVAYFYLDGNFTPDLSDNASNIPPNAQERDYWVKYFVTVDELSAYYNQACEYYETLCSVLED